MQRSASPAECFHLVKQILPLSAKVSVIGSMPLGKQESCPHTKHVSLTKVQQLHGSNSS